MLDSFNIFVILEGCLQMYGSDGAGFLSYCAYFSVINPAPSDPNIRKHPSNRETSGKYS